MLNGCHGCTVLFRKFRIESPWGGGGGALDYENDVCLPENESSWHLVYDFIEKRGVIRCGLPKNWSSRLKKKKKKKKKKNGESISV